MKKILGYLTFVATSCTLLVVTLASTPLGEAVLQNVPKNLPVMCWWGLGDVKQPESVVEARRKRMGIH